MITSKKNKKCNRLDDLSPQRDESFNAKVTEVGEAVDKLIRIRGGHRSAFAKLEKKLDDLVANPISDEKEQIQAEALLVAIKSKHQCITHYDAEVELKIDDDRLADDMERSATWEQRMMVTEARLTALLNNYKKESDSPLTVPTSASVGSSKVRGNQMKLPKLALPTFTISYTDSMSFADLFHAAVNFNQSLTKSEKLNYLKAYVKGDAAKLISSITITDANYAFAIDLLKQRYENKWNIVQAHLQTVWNQSPMKRESASGLRKLLETTNKHLRALNDLGQPTNQWDCSRQCQASPPDM